MLRKTFIAVLSVFAASAALAQAYKWVDENGIVHYSDKPQEGWERRRMPLSRSQRCAATPRAAMRAAGSAVCY